MKISKESYQIYSAPTCVATITLIASIPRMVSNFYPGSTSKGILISGLASSAMTFFFTASPEFRNTRELALDLSITSIFTFTIGIPFLSKAYEKAMKKTQIVMTGYLTLGVECAFGVLLFEAIGRDILFPQKKPRERYRSPPVPPPKAKAKPKPNPEKKVDFLPKDPPPYSILKEGTPSTRDPWEQFDELGRKAQQRMQEERLNPPPFDIPGTPPNQTYRPLI